MMGTSTNRHFLVTAMLAAVLALAGVLAPHAVQAQAMSVTIQSFYFQPSTLTVPVGTTVTWTNMATVTHTSTSDSGVWDSGTIAPGASYQYTFTTAGTFPYHCMIHPFMHGTIVVGSGTPPATGHPTVSVTPNSVMAGMTAIVQGAGFTANNWAFAHWQRPDGTMHNLWVFTDSAGMFAFRLLFKAEHGVGTEFVTAFDAATRAWAPYVAVSVTPGTVRIAGQLFSSPNPVANGHLTNIAGSGFTPNTRVFVEWRRPNGSMAAIWVFTNGAGSFLFTLFADPHQGCGARTFVGIDVASHTQTAPFVLNEIC